MHGRCSTRDQERPIERPCPLTPRARGRPPAPDRRPARPPRHRVPRLGPPLVQHPPADGARDRPEDQGPVAARRPARQQPALQDGHPVVGRRPVHLRAQQRVLCHERGDGRGRVPAQRVDRPHQVRRPHVPRVGRGPEQQDQGHPQRRPRRPHPGRQDAHRGRQADVGRH